MSLLSYSLPSPAELLNFAAYLHSTNQTAGKLQTDHGQGQTNTGGAVQQKHQSATKTDTVSKSGHSIGSRLKYLDTSSDITMPTI